MNKSYKVLIMSKKSGIIILFLIFAVTTCKKEETVMPLEMEAEVRHVTHYGGNDGDRKSVV